jgi:hypothetical protein
MTDSADIQHMQMILGTCMALAALGTLLLSIAGRWIGGALTTMLAIVAAMLLAYQPLVGSSPFEDLKTDVLRRILIGLIPFTLCLIILSIKPIPGFIRLLFVLIVPALFLYWVFSHFDVTVPRQTLFFHKIVPLCVFVFVSWCAIEPIARRNPGAAAPIVIGPVTGGLAFLLMLSSETQAGLIAPVIPATALGALLAAIIAVFIHKPISFARGPVLLWIMVIAGVFAFMWLDTDKLPTPYLWWILTGPLLAWVCELKPIHRLKPWKRESIRLVLVSIPVIAAVAFAYKQHRDEAKAAGDEYGMVAPAAHPAAPILPSQIPMPNTINPPMIT